MKTSCLLSFLLLTTSLFANDQYLFKNTPFKAPVKPLAYTVVQYRPTPAKEKDKPAFSLTNVLQLEERLKEKIHGQNSAIESTVQSIVRYAAGLNDPESPIATLLYIGPTGVGKTELAKQLAQELTGSKAGFIRLDMSEYTEPHTVSRLIGTPPGYVGYDMGGQLTESIKARPNSIILLDEIEKAHPNVAQIFLQAFDDARITDAKGNVVDCRKCLFILTTNLASSSILRLQQANTPYEEIVKAIQPQLMASLSPELYNRLEVVLFTGLSNASFKRVVNRMLDSVCVRIKANKGITLNFDPSVVQFLVEKGYQYELGARPLKRLINKEIVTSLGYTMIQETFEPGSELKVSYKNGKIIIEKSSS
ncbi:MAG: ATP-dependent Clp protease ATP-binding subunit [Parachlamydiales bacterium]|nr:ATP-dependent Clp protease ATP-binding subunit [Parachlamydiales bacterium]